MVVQATLYGTVNILTGAKNCGGLQKPRLYTRIEASDQLPTARAGQANPSTPRAGFAAVFDGASADIAATSNREGDKCTS